MTVLTETKAFIYNYFKIHSNYFDIFDEDNKIHFEIKKGMFKNHFYKINNILLDTNKNKIFIDYKLNDIPYRFVMDIDKEKLLVLNTCIFISKFINIYRAGLSLSILSEHEASFIYSNNRFSIEKQKMRII